MSQLDLPLALKDYAVFETFHADGNEGAVAHLEQLCAGHPGESPGCWLWGPKGTGKSHLLQAVCARAEGRAAYLPLGDPAFADSGILEGMAGEGPVCLDDVDRVAGRGDWERALFNLFNRAMERKVAVVAAGSAVPRSLPFGLPDLESRFSALPPFRLQRLDDDGLATALSLRARHRGLDLPGDTARFLVKRARRDMASLYALLDRLESAALSARRRLTVPFVSSVLSETELPAD